MKTQKEEKKEPSGNGIVFFAFQYYFIFSAQFGRQVEEKVICY
jgi:hypothetical protein